MNKNSLTLNFQQILNEALLKFPYGIAICENFHIVKNNSTLELMLCIEENSALNLPIDHFVDPKYNDFLKRVSINNDPKEFHIELRRHDNTYFSASFIIWNIGDSPYQIILISDISKSLQYREISKSIFESLTIPFYIMQNYKLIKVSDAFCELSGYSREELLDDIFDIKTLIHKKHQHKVLKQLKEKLRGSASAFEPLEFLGITKSQKELWIRATSDVHYINNYLTIITHIENIDYEKRSYDALAKSEKSLKTILDNIPVVILLTKNNNIVYVNDEALRISGYTKKQRDSIIINSSLLNYLDEDSQVSFMQALKENNRISINLNIIDVHGKEIPVEGVAAKKIKYMGDDVTMFIMRDLRDQNYIEFLKTHDPSTNLLNIDGFSFKIKDFLRNNINLSYILMNIKIKSRTSRSLLFSNTTDYKNIKEEIMCILTDKLLLKLPLKGNIFARDPGSVEFFIFASKVKTEDEITDIIDRVMTIFPQEFQDEDIEAVIGVTQYPGNNYFEDTPVSLIINDSIKARKIAEEEKKVDFCIYNKEDNQNILNNIQIDRALNLETKNDFKNMEIYYQALYNRDLEIVGAELLTRWFHPQFKALCSNTELVFQRAEKNHDFVEAFGRWHILQLINNLSEVSNSKKHSTNLFAQQINEGFLQYVKDKTFELSVNPAIISFEILEYSILNAKQIELLYEFRQHGFKIFIDDFGDGNIGINQTLEMMHVVDGFKISKDTLSMVCTDSRRRITYEGIIGITKKTGLTSICEGIETENDFKLARDMGFDQFQGYWLGSEEKNKPVPLKEFIKKFK